VPLDLGGILGLELLEEVRNLLVGFDQNLAEVLANVLVAIIVEGSGLALVANAGSAADAVDVLGDAVVLSRRQVVVDDVLDVGDIKATSRDTSGDQERAASSAEGAPDDVLEVYQVEELEVLTVRPHAHAECDQSEWK
jgi:hypothetical protein